MITEPETWPYPFLPLNHRWATDRGLPKPGVLLNLEDLTVYEMSMYDLPMMGGTLSKEELDNIKHTRFLTADALLAVWAVD